MRAEALKFTRLTNDEVEAHLTALAEREDDGAGRERLVALHAQLEAEEAAGDGEERARPPGLERDVAAEPGRGAAARAQADAEAQEEADELERRVDVDEEEHARRDEAASAERAHEEGEREGQRGEREEERPGQGERGDRQEPAAEGAHRSGVGPLRERGSRSPLRSRGDPESSKINPEPLLSQP